MDRRSWLWRRKSSDKSSGETESLGSGSGSMSSPSERFSDEQQVYSMPNVQSPDVTSIHGEVTHDSVKILSEKLSSAFATINEKEELVKQHAKVAEEAVNGWEMAENEMNVLKQQLDAATQKNSTLEDKVSHLDGALKECLRQLRQVREEQDQRIQEAVVKKSEDTDPKSSQMQDELSDISAQLEIANAKAEAAISVESELRLKLASAEKESASLRLERDFSTKRAETASKQHLESIKKVAKLDAECRQLKASARKGNSFRTDKNSLESHVVSSPNTGFMDDFLEMEKLAALPVKENKSSSSGSVASIDKHDQNGNDSAFLRTELEERIEMVEAEKVELGTTLTEFQDKLQISENSFKQLQVQFNDCQNELKMSQAQLKDANKKIGMLQAELDLAGELRQAIDLELDDANVGRENAEARLKVVESESRNLQSKVTLLENDAKTWQNQLVSLKKSKEAVERELKNANRKKESTELELKTVRKEVKSLQAKIDSLENDREKERRSSAEFDSKCTKLESELSKARNDIDSLQSKFTSVNNLKEGVTRELQIEKSKKEEVERHLETVQGEAKSLLARVSSLEHEVDKERLSSVEFATKCRKLEGELGKMKSEVGIQFPLLSKEELKKEQEKEIAVAASKLADCQKTIASLDNQLKSLATLEDFFSDSDNQLDISDKNSQLLKMDIVSANFHSSSAFTIQSDPVISETHTRNSFSVSTEDAQEFAKDVKGKESLSSLVVDKNHKNGFGKYFSRSRSTVRTRNSRQ